MRWGALLLLAALPALPAYARSHRGTSHHNETWAKQRFADAERMREALNGRPPADRSRHDYQRVINAYRSVYYGAPASSKADPSVVAVAETLVEMGRRFEDDKILNSAIGQYKFLRREYPGSKYRCDALFTIGEIYKDDLDNPQQASAAFREFLKRYPHNRLAEDAQQAIGEIDRQAQSGKKADAEKATTKLAADKATVPPESSSKDKALQTKADSVPETGASAAESQGGHLPRVTGIRHWSTPDYTRVAIDLESGVKFGSQRIDNPDRIFFDLRDTKLASTLVGKSFDVDDGLLKKIRVAQFQPGRTRVVLEVDNLSDYDSFLLPDPYRLIIDIHGKGTPGKNARGKEKTDGSAENVAKNGAETADTRDAARLLSEAAPAPTAAGAKPAESVTPQSKVENLRAAAGKAPVTREDVGDDVKIVEKNSRGTVNSSAHDKKAAAARGEVPAPTKVIVDADDDEPAPSRPTTASSADTSSAGADGEGRNGGPNLDSGGDSQVVEKALSHRPASSRTRGKSGTKLKTSEGDSMEAEIREASPTAHGDRSLIRALGLKIGKIVIDPGHGGHDTGTIGPNGLEEKDLVLEVGRKLGKLLETRLGAEVVYTRKDDTFIPLETRTAIANQQRADLFISIHANSSHDPAARGVETYYLNFTSSPEALEVAARENAVSEKSIYELQDLVKKIALKEKIEESREFASDVQESLHSGLAAKSSGIRNRGVKKAPFIVLIGANMPSILAEISFVSNPGDEHRLETSEYRQRIAESLYKGIAKYVNGLSGVKVASKIEKVSAQ